MKLAISNIGWDSGNDLLIYEWMRKYGYSGLEIAPTRIFPEKPYERNADAVRWEKELQDKYGFVVPSMQSIWYGRQEEIFGTEEERRVLVDYTKKAIVFAETIGCRNLVFGCPRNRSIPDGTDSSVGIWFFREIGDYAAEHNTVVAMEANPLIYNTNYINTTEDAIRLIEDVDSPGFRLNLDVGTMIENGENIAALEGKVDLINHVHISEPGLKPIEHRSLHKELRDFLFANGYQRFVSIEMGKVDDAAVIEEKMDYVRQIFE